MMSKIVVFMGKKYINIFFLVLFSFPVAAHSELIYKKIDRVLSGQAFDEAAEPLEGKGEGEPLHAVDLPRSLPFSGATKYRGGSGKDAVGITAQYGENGEPLPQLKEQEPFNKVLPEEKIYKKQYSKENSHLPQLTYKEEYKALLFQAVVKGQVALIHAFTKRLDSTEVQDDEGNTPLMIAVLSNNMASLQVLLGLDAAVNAVNNYHLSPLHIAILKQNNAMSRALLEWEADVNQLDQNKSTPLMLAVQENNQELVDLLSQFGADPNLKRVDGVTALHLAVQNRSKEMVQKVMALKADVNAVSDSGDTPLSIAVASNSTEIVDQLLASGAIIPEEQMAQQKLYQAASYTGNVQILELLEAKKILASLREQKIESIERVNLVEEEQEKAKNTPFAPIPIQKPWFKGTDKVVPKPYFEKSTF